jgi:hypothetical protein
MADDEASEEMEHRWLRRYRPCSSTISMAARPKAIGFISPAYERSAGRPPDSRRSGEAFSVKGMSSHAPFTLEQARAAGVRIGIDWDASPFSLEQFRMGMDVELEHGTRDPATNVTDDDVIMTAKIARAHLNEFPDYYTRLAKMEAEAEADWTTPEA